MAMTINQDAHSPASPGATDTTSPTNDKPTQPTTEDQEKNKASTTGPAANGNGNVKRKPSRRANTAERRATHNAVERQRRETLNGRFLDLAALLPNLSQIRRPSKSSIVNSSIAYIHASRRHRAFASRELRALTTETNALRRELNEWRDRANLPRVEEPLRSEAYHVVIGGEMDAMMVSAEMGNHANMEGEEADGDGMDEWGVDGQQGSYEDEQIHSAHPAYVQQQPPFVAAHPQAYPAPHPYAHGGHPSHPHAHPGHHPQQMGFIEDDGRPVSKHGNPFAHNIPRGYGGEAGQGAGALFTPPVSRDGPIHPSNNGSSNGGASPAHSAHSHHTGGSASPVATHARSMSGSPTGFQAANGRRGTSGSPSYELGPSANGPAFSPYTHAGGPMNGGYSHGGYQQQSAGYQGQGGAPPHMMQSGPGMGMGGGMQMQGPGMGMQGMGVGAGAMGGVYGMML